MIPTLEKKKEGGRENCLKNRERREGNYEKKDKMNGKKISLTLGSKSTKR